MLLTLSTLYMNTAAPFLLGGERLLSLAGTFVYRGTACIPGDHSSFLSVVECACWGSQLLLIYRNPSDAQTELLFQRGCWVSPSSSQFIGWQLCCQLGRLAQCSRLPTPYLRWLAGRLCRQYILILTSSLLLHMDICSFFICFCVCVSYFH